MLIQFEAVETATPLLLIDSGKTSLGSTHPIGPSETPYATVKVYIALKNGSVRWCWSQRWATYKTAVQAAARWAGQSLEYCNTRIEIVRCEQNVNALPPRRSGFRPGPKRIRDGEDEKEIPHTDTVDVDNGGYNSEELHYTDASGDDKADGVA